MGPGGRCFGHRPLVTLSSILWKYDVSVGSLGAPTLLDKAEAFIVVRVYTDEASLQHPKGAGPATQKWLKDGAAEKMKQLVQAMLIVVPEEQYQKFQNMSVQKAFGIPGAVFKSLDDATTWLQASAKEIAIPENIELQDVALLVHSHCGNTH